MKLTYRKAAAGGRVVHALQGGGEGTKDITGIPRYFAGITLCGVHLSSPKLNLVETDHAVTCKRCISIMDRFERKLSQNK